MSEKQPPVPLREGDTTSRGRGRDITMIDFRETTTGTPERGDTTSCGRGRDTTMIDVDDYTSITDIRVYGRRSLVKMCYVQTRAHKNG